MASDRARISFDPTRDYRAVLAQQGRVTLEADVNEAGLIALEALRLETIDIIGPTGAVGGGYEVNTAGGGVFIAEGVLYVGGWRLQLTTPVDITQQPDWLDRPGQEFGGTDVVSLLLTEQSVCAVEDQALREVALGGPDSAARLRLMQRFLVTQSGDTCAEGAKTMTGLLDADGVDWDPGSLQLKPRSTLLVGFVPPAAPPDPCTPVAAGGYLGADNQLIRVSLVDYDTQARAGHFVWGWNNASFLYRAVVTDPKAFVLSLTGAPVDEEHAPQLGQAVEILRSRASLGDNDFIAADSGHVTTVTQAYSFDTGQLTLADLPPEYLSDPNPLFVRLWQDVVAFNAGQATALDAASGVTVTLDPTGTVPGAIAARPFWRFAVRPDTPVQIYPARYQETPQPPDGPRQWLVDLAVIGPAGEGFTVLEDCRVPFLPLTEQTGGCCGLTLDPAGVAARGGLQAVLDSLAGTGATLSLEAGMYTLAAPLALDGRHDNLVIEGCGPGVFIQSDPQQRSAFRLGLASVVGARLVTFRRVNFELDPVAFDFGGKAGFVSMIGLTLKRTYGVTVEECIFRFAAVPPAPPAFIIGAGVLCEQREQGLRIRRCQFLATDSFAGRAGADVMGVVALGAVGRLVVTLDDVAIEGCVFRKLLAGVFAFANLGEVALAENRVAGCQIGFLLASLGLGALGAFVREGVGARDAAGRPTSLAASLQGAALARVLGAVLANAGAWGPPDAAAGASLSTEAEKVLRADMVRQGSEAYAALTAHLDTMAKAEPAAAAPAPAPAAAAPPAQAAEQVAADHALFTEGLHRMDEVAVAAAEHAGLGLQMVIRVRDNDVSLAGAGPKAQTGDSFGVNVTSGIGRGVGGQGADVLISGNRVLTADTRSPACAVMFPAAAVITGNLFAQTGGAKTFVFTPALTVMHVESAPIAVSGNVVRTSAAIFPDRVAPQPSPAWAFLNAIG